MGIELEKRLRKLEKAQQAKMDSTVIDQEEMKKRDELRQLMSTPEGRRLVRKLAMESAERIRSAMQAQERAQLEAMTSPEVLERLRKQWAEEDARWEALKAENERVEAWIESLGGRQCRVPPDSEHWISESEMAIDRRENLPGGRDGQTESVDGGQALSDCERGVESKGADGTDCQTAPSLGGIDLSMAGEVLRRRQSGVSL
jgi:hypothetical protein